MALLLKEEEVRELLPMSVAIDAVEQALRARAEGWRRTEPL